MQEKTFTSEEVRKLLWEARIFYSQYPTTPFRHLRPLFKEWADKILKTIKLN